MKGEEEQPRKKTMALQQSQSKNESQKSDEKDSIIDYYDAQMTLFQQFKQQMFRAWQPIPTLTKTITLFYVMTVIFLGIGIPMLVLSQNIVENKIRYDNVCTPSQASCVLTLNINEKIQNPIFVYYELHNYYQNHRLYAKSVSQGQLSGQSISESEASELCAPFIKNSDLYVSTSIDGTPLDPNAIANPCGAIAYSIFNDTYTIALSGNTIPVSTEGIQWQSDRNRYKLSNAGTMWYNVTDPRFMNWMRISTLPNFRKLWGRINQDLEAGAYTITINNQYNVEEFHVQKYFVISTSNVFGSKNSFLSIIYIVMGSLCFVIACAFLARKLTKVDPKED